MNDNDLTISRGMILTLALECWRAMRELERMKDQPNTVGLRYSLRKMKGALEELGVSYMDMTGRPYDAGMALDIVDVEGEEGEGELVVKEMVAPIILLEGALLAWGEAVLERRATAPIE